MSPERIRPGSAGAGADSGEAPGEPNSEAVEESEEQDQAIEATTATPEPEEAPESLAWIEDQEELAEEELLENEELTSRAFDNLEAEVEPADALSLAATNAATAALLDDDDEDEERVRFRPTRPDKPHGIFRKIYLGETNIEFVRRRRIWFSISAVIILAGVISLGTRGLNLGIEFVGGTSWTVQSTQVTITQAQNAVSKAGLVGSVVTILGNNATHSRTVQVEAKLPKGQSSKAAQAEASKVATALSDLAHTSTEKVSIETVGPSWGGQITHKAIVALIVFFILIALYISVFFEWRMALGAIIAVLHDILVTVGIYSLSGLQVTPDTVVAFLTILGYSLYDTIVVFDRIRDNLAHLTIRDRLTITDIVNLSMNQTLARSINTSLVAIMPILAVLVLGAQILGATTLQYFGIALLVGLTTGAYSSIFIASPLVAVFKEGEQKFRIIRERLEARGADRWLLSPAALAAGQFGDAGAPVRRANPQRVARSAPSRIVPGQSGPERARQVENGESEPQEALRKSGSAPRAAAGQARRPVARSKRKGGRR